MELLPIIGGLISLFGSLFLLLGAIGIVRMPDSYNKIQAGTKATYPDIKGLPSLYVVCCSWDSISPIPHRTVYQMVYEVPINSRDYFNTGITIRIRG